MLRLRPRPGSPVNTGGWLMSYADMATLLLALFLVLSTLSRDQTGVSLYNGTRAFARTRRPPPASVPSETPTPPYLYRPPPQAGDADEGDEPVPHFLHELGRQFPVTRLRRQAGQVVLDLYEPLGREAPYLAAKHRAALGQLRPLLDRPDYQVVLVVWAATPAPSAWGRAAEQARAAADAFAADAGLGPQAAARLVPLAQPWRYRDVRRPVLSLLVVKLGEG